MQVHYRKLHSFQDGEKFDNRGNDGIFVGWFLWPGGIFKGDLFAIDLDEMIKAPTGSRPRMYRVKEVRTPAIGVAFPLRAVQLEARQRMLADQTEFAVDPVDPVDSDEDRSATEEEQPSGSTDLVRAPRASRFYVPRVGPRPAIKVPPLNDDLIIEFQ